MWARSPAVSARLCRYSAAYSRSSDTTVPVKAPGLPGGSASRSRAAIAGLATQ